MKNFKLSSASFAMVLVLVSFVLLCSCHQARNVTVYTVAPALKAYFGFQQGSYWIYKDSTSGEVDSAFVTDYIVNSSPESCLSTGPLHEFLTIQINVVNTSKTAASTQPPLYEAWSINMYDSNMKFALINSYDSVESKEVNLALAKYPFAVGYYSLPTDCIQEGYADSANITTILPSFSVNGQTFSNTAVSYHGNTPHTNDIYDDFVYISASAGIVKVVFNHHPNSIHRVLELQRYKLVK